MGRAGWIAILGLGDTVTVSVPFSDLREVVVEALAGLSPADATAPDAVVPRIPGVRDTLGPAPLFYLPAGFDIGHTPGDEAAPGELDLLLAAAPADDVEESGFARADGPVFVSRTATGTVAAACSFARWPNGVAHISVLTHPHHRRKGHAARAAKMVVRAALDEGLVPQWRARPVASQRLAERLGFVRMGAQLGLQPSAVVTFRHAGHDDATAIAALHADSWRRHYRGAYSDAYLDGPVFDERRAVWSERLAASDADETSATILAERGDELVGFVHVIFEAEPEFGPLIDNLHVRADMQRTGLGRELVIHAANDVVARRPGRPMHLWVLEQNVRAQAFYDAIGGRRADARVTQAPGGGEINAFRYVWDDPSRFGT